MSEKDEILIDAYLRGTLTAEDKLFLAERLHDDDFKQKYDEATTLLQVLKEEDAKKMKARMQSIEKNEFEKSNLKGKSNAMKLGLFALIIGLVLLTYFLMLGGTENNQELYASYYESYPNVIDPIVKGKTNTLSVYQHYELKDYPKVIELLTSKPTLNSNEQFCLASAYLGENKLTKASKLFEALQNTELYSDPSEWYLALICIKAERASCNGLFDSIASNNSNIYHKKAEELLKKLKD